MIQIQSSLEDMIPKLNIRQQSTLLEEKILPK